MWRTPWILIVLMLANLLKRIFLVIRYFSVPIPSFNGVCWIVRIFWYPNLSSMFSAAFLVTLFFLVLQVEKLKELSKLPDIYDRLTRSLAPNIWELDDVKRGLLCQVTSWNIKMFF